MINHLWFSILIHNLRCILRIIDPISEPIKEVLGTNQCPLLWSEFRILAVWCFHVIAVNHRLCSDDIHLLADLRSYCCFEECSFSILSFCISATFALLSSLSISISTSFSSLGVFAYCFRSSILCLVCYEFNKSLCAFVRHHSNEVVNLAPSGIVFHREGEHLNLLVVLVTFYLGQDVLLYLSKNADIVGIIPQVFRQLVKLRVDVVQMMHTLVIDSGINLVGVCILLSRKDSDSFLSSVYSCHQFKLLQGVSEFLCGIVIHRHHLNISDVAVLPHIVPHALLRERHG